MVRRSQVTGSHRSRARQVPAFLAVAALVTTFLWFAQSPALAAVPEAFDGGTSTAKNTPADIFLETYDDDFDELAITIVTPPAHGDLDDCSTGVCTYTPDTGFVGTDSFTWKAYDGTSFSTVATFGIEVLAPSPPDAYDGNSSTAKDVPVAVYLEAYDNDDDPLTYAIVSPPVHGDLTSCSDGTCTYTPDAGFVGLDAFTWRANDGSAFSNTAGYDITVFEPGAPEAFGTHVDAAGDDVTDLTLGGSSDAGLPLTFAVTQSPAHGVLGTLGAPDCSGGYCEVAVTYTAAAGYRGPDELRFTVSDGTKVSTPAIVDIAVVNAPCKGAVVTNGTVKLGVNCKGELNVGDDGLKYVPTGNDSTSAGCACEGWGVADQTTGVTGYANQSTGTSENVSVLSFTHDAQSATSKVAVGGTFEVTHDYQPSDKTVNAYKVTVSVKNTSAGPAHLRYRRAMDWDVEPTPFNEFVTIDKGTASELVFTSDNGFATTDPLAGPSDLGHTGNFVDSGPADHGALFDFDFGTLAAGDTRTFVTFYGAAGTESGATGALAAVGAEAYSLGEPSTADGPTLGTPNTFFFGFGAVGGTPIFAPHAVNDTLTTEINKPATVNVVANDTDPNGDSLTVTGKTNGAHGTVSCTTTSCTYTPTIGYTGADSFTYTISDGHGGTDTGTVAVTVTGGTNTPPDAVNDTTTTPKNTAKAISVLANDTDANGDTLTVTTPSPAAGHGTVSCTSTVCTYTPTTNYVGADSFTYGISDGHGGTDTATVSITVTAVNDPPNAVNDTTSTNEDTPKAISVLTNDTDANGDTLSVTTSSPLASHGTVACTSTVCTYTPAANYNGPDSFTYGISDGHGGTDTATVSITVTAVNDPPDAVNDTTTTPEDTAKAISVLTNDTDVDGDTLTVTTASPLALHGTVACTSTVCTYTPALNYNGPDFFTYGISDGHGGTDTATVGITVTAVNDAPDAVNDTTTTAEDTAKAVSVLANDTDVDGDTMSVTTASPVAGHGTVSCTSTVCTYTPTLNYNGPDSFTYGISDGHGGTDTATVNITVTAVNDAPDAVNDTTTTPEDTAKAVGVLANDTDVDGDTLSVTTATPTAGHGTVSCTSTVCTYTPAANYNGPDSFTYGISDGHGGTDTATVSITVTAVNDAPNAIDDAAQTEPGTAKAVSVLANDTDVDGDTLSVTTPTPTAGHGTVSCTSTVCTYTPEAGFSGTDSFTYGISDAQGGADTALVSFSVSTVVSDGFDLGIVKAPLASSVVVGALTGYQLVIHNYGPNASPAYVVKDVLPQGFKLWKTTSAACVGTTTVTCNLPALAPGATLTIVVRGAFLKHGSLANTATVTATGDADPVNNSSSVQTAVVGQDCTIVGTFGNDRINGTNARDVICGLAGDDKINGKLGNDVLYGNEGNDWLMGLGGNDNLNGGPGTDTVQYSALLQSVRVNLGTRTATGQGTDTLVSIENVEGSGKADVLIGDALANLLSGLGGNDIIKGGAGKDRLLGGAGADSLSGGTGNDTLSGGIGKDACSQGTGTGPKSSC